MHYYYYVLLCIIIIVVIIIVIIIYIHIPVYITGCTSGTECEFIKTSLVFLCLVRISRTNQTNEQQWGTNRPAKLALSSNCPFSGVNNFD